MRIAIISDIHSNLQALEAVLTDLSAQPEIDRIYCLGDLVGYGPDPNGVVARIRELGVPTVMGNYDDGIGFERGDCGCAYKTDVDRRIGELSVSWTEQHTTANSKAFLRTLLPEIRVTVDEKRVLLVHGSPRRINEYLFEDRDLRSFQRLAAGADADVIVFGHTHIPFTKDVEGVLFVNAGSVGKPKDGDPRACYTLLDIDASRIAVRFRRIVYDVSAVAAAIQQSGLPNELADQLVSGGTPTPGA
jgi:putative phosphoesterase